MARLTYNSRFVCRFFSKVSSIVSSAPFSVPPLDMSLPAAPRTPPSNSDHLDGSSQHHFLSWLGFYLPAAIYPRVANATASTHHSVVRTAAGDCAPHQSNQLAHL